MRGPISSRRSGRCAPWPTCAASRGIGYISDMIFDQQLDYYALLGREDDPALTSNSLMMQLRWCLRGAGICILPDFVAREHPELGRLLPEEVRLTRAFYLVRHQDDARVARINRMAEVVVRGCGRRWRRAAGPDRCSGIARSGVCWWLERGGGETWRARTIRHEAVSPAAHRRARSPGRRRGSPSARPDKGMRRASTGGCRDELRRLEATFEELRGAIRKLQDDAESRRKVGKKVAESFEKVLKFYSKREVQQALPAESDAGDQDGAGSARPCRHGASLGCAGRGDAGQPCIRRCGHEAQVFHPSRGSLTGSPVGWTLVREAARDGEEPT